MRRLNVYWCSATVPFRNNYIGVNPDDFDKLLMASFAENSRNIAKGGSK